MNILITDGLSTEGIAILKSHGLTVDVVKFSPDELLGAIANYDALIVRSATKATKEVIAAGKNLKVIGRAGVGVDNIDVTYAREKGIQVLNTPGASAISVAELAIAHMFALSRFLHVSTNEMRNGNWPKKEYSKGIELSNKKLGIMGFGSIGREVARRGIGLGMSVLAYDPLFSHMDFYVELTSKERVLAESDFLTLHLPFDPAGPPIGKNEIAMMKEGVVIINCARGGVIDEEALLEALESGKVRGAGFDVFSKEPPGESLRKLITHPRVSLSPHIGGSTIEAQDRVGVEIAHKVAQALIDERR